MDTTFPLHAGVVEKPIVERAKKKVAIKQVTKLPVLRIFIDILQKTILEFIRFNLLLLLYLINTQLVDRSLTMRWLPGSLRSNIQRFFSIFYSFVTRLLDSHQEGTVAKLDLIDLAIRNMQTKRTRAVITIGGMAIGISVIVFLVSLGYGLEKLVISKVAQLNQMKQAEITPKTGSLIKITDKTIEQIKEVSNVDKVAPMITVVGKVSYQKSVTDVAVFGATTDYLKQSDIKPELGRFYDSNAITVVHSPSEVAGQSTIDISKVEKKLNQIISTVSFSTKNNEWIPLYASADPKSKILGYVSSQDKTLSAQLLWGKGPNYAKDKTNLTQWLQGTFPVWQKKSCAKEAKDCSPSYIPLQNPIDTQQQKMGFMSADRLTLNIANNNVLAATTSTASTPLEVIEIASESATTKESTGKVVDVGVNALKEAIVNRAFLQVLGMKDTEAIGKEFSTTFIVSGSLLDDNQDKIQSSPTTYKIVGIISDAKTPVVYVPLNNITSLGVKYYSQLKVSVNNQLTLSSVRSKIEAMGFITQSVADTVSQINSLFATLRTFLALLGMAALAVASLGMFNTLTISLLERTHEVGLMKAMGMKSDEVRELFLTESMIMGFFGGILGIFFGFLFGKSISLILSAIALSKGYGFLDISYIPFSFIFVVLFLSFMVGVFTGIYPAHRATKISALDALRYE